MWNGISEKMDVFSRVEKIIPLKRGQITLAKSASSKLPIYFYVSFHYANKCC